MEIGLGVQWTWNRRVTLTTCLLFSCTWRNVHLIRVILPRATVCMYSMVTCRIALTDRKKLFWLRVNVLTGETQHCLHQTSALVTGQGLSSSNKNIIWAASVCMWSVTANQQIFVKVLLQKNFNTLGLVAFYVGCVSRLLPLAAKNVLDVFNVLVDTHVLSTSCDAAAFLATWRNVTLTWLHSCSTKHWQTIAVLWCWPHHTAWSKQDVICSQLQPQHSLVLVSSILLILAFFILELCWFFFIWPSTWPHFSSALALRLPVPGDLDPNNLSTLALPAVTWHWHLLL